MSRFFQSIPRICALLYAFIASSALSLICFNKPISLAYWTFLPPLCFVPLDRGCFVPPSFSQSSVIDAITTSQWCDSLSTNSCTTATVSDAVSSGVDDDESSVLIGSSNRHAASSTKLVSGDPDDAAGIAFAVGFALAVMPLALLELVVSVVAVRSTTASDALRLGVGFIRGGSSPDSSERRRLGGGGGGWSGGQGVSFARCACHLPDVPVVVRDDLLLGHLPTLVSCCQSLSSCQPLSCCQPLSSCQSVQGFHLDNGFCR